MVSVPPSKALLLSPLNVNNLADDDAAVALPEVPFELPESITSPAVPSLEAVISNP